MTAAMLSLIICPAWAEVQFSDSYVIRPPNAAVRSAVAVTKISNLNAHGVDLVGVSSPDAEKVEYHLLEHKNGVVSMTAQPVVHIEGNALLELHEGGLHIMLTGLGEAFSEQLSTEITFFFSDGSRLTQTFTLVHGAPRGSQQIDHEHH